MTLGWLTLVLSVSLGAPDRGVVGLEDESPRAFLARVDKAVEAVETLAYSARFEREELEPGADAPALAWVEGQQWLARHDLDDGFGWKACSWTRMSHASVRHEGVYAHWAYDGEKVTLIHPEKGRAHRREGEGVQSIVVDFFRGNLIPRQLLATQDWRTPQVDPFVSLMGETSDASMDGVEEVDGVECVVLSVIHRPSSSSMMTESSMRWSIATEDLIPRRLEHRWVFDQTRYRETLEITDVRIDRPIPDRVFAPDLPAAFGTPTTQGSPPQESLGHAPKVGSKVPAFELVDGDGEINALRDYEGELVLLDFWGTWCGPCRMALPGLQKLHEEFGDKGFSVLGISCREKEDADPVQFMEQRGYTYQVLLEGEGVAKQYGVKAYPTLFLLDGEGSVIYRFEGFDKKEESRLSELIARRLSDEES